MLKVLNVIFDERIGGPQLRVLSIAKQLKSRRIATTVVIPKGHSAFRRQLQMEGIGVYQIPLYRLRDSRNPFVHLKWLIFFWPSIVRIIQIIWREQIDIVHTNGIAHLQAAIAAKLAGVKLVWHLNDINTPRLLIKLIKPLVEGWADGIAVASHAVTNHYWLGDPPERKFIQYAPVDVKKFTNQDGPTDKLLQGLKRSGVLICSVGNINPYKGHRYLIEALAQIAKTYPQVHLVIVGGVLENRLDYYNDLKLIVGKLGIQDKVSFLGQRDDVPRILNASDIYVHPSLAEACPMAVLEAMAVGKPIVATQVGGVPEMIENLKTGMLVPPEDPNALADAIEWVIGNLDASRLFGVEAQKKARDIFDLEKCTQRHFDMYCQVGDAN